MAKKESNFDKKIIILGIDALSPKIMEPLMREGKLPNFLKLKEMGSYKQLSTTNPSQSPVAWAGFATGQNPGENGIFDFIIRDPSSYNLNLSLSNIEKGAPRRVIKSKCFWQYSSDKKIPTVIISCPVTFPPDKVYGRMLSGMGVPDILGTEGTFTFYTTERISKDKDIGGNVFEIKKSPTMVLNLIGPKIARPWGEPKNTKVLFKASLKDNQDGAFIEYQDKRVELKVGEWSNWQEVVFKLGLLKKLHGIFKFYLVETHPDFKLYISPINFHPQNPFFQISYPKRYSKALAENIGLYHTQGMPIDTWAVNEKRLCEGPLLEQINEAFREKKAMLDFELSHFKKGVFFCYFQSLDVVQHMFWRYIDPKHPLYESGAPVEYKEMINNWYKKMDAVLGKVIPQINDGDTLIVISDHGFDSFRRAVHINSWLRKNGYLQLLNPLADSGAELLKDIDWSKTQAYAIGFGAIYINQRGREKEGIVNPGKETESLKNDLSQKLKYWIDEKYNSNIINNVYKREDIFDGNFTDKTPDLYLGFNTGYRASWQTALGGTPEGLIEDNLKKWSGDHLFDPVLIPGVIFSNRHIIKDNPSIYDITPTVLKTAGFNEEELKQYNFDGSPLFLQK